MMHEGHSRLTFKEELKVYYPIFVEHDLGYYCLYH